jgi:hypothetical protein
MQPMLFSGARGKILRTSPTGQVETLAVVLDINVSRNDGVQTTFVVGSLNGVANDPTGTDVSVGFSAVVPVSDSTGKVDTKHLTSVGQQLTPTLKSILISNALTIEVQDRITNRVVASIRECRFTGENLSLAATSVGTKRFNYVGILDAGYDGKENVATNLGYGPQSA